MVETDKNQQNKTEPTLEKTLETLKDSKLKELFTRIAKNIKPAGHDKEIIKIKEKIIDEPEQPEQQVFAFLPHEIAKVSIFFPMSDKELKEENRRINKIEHKTGWGKITIEGIKLAIFEEDVLLALMKISRHKLQCVEGQYILEINIKEIIHLLYGTSNYNPQKAVNLIIRTLDHFQLVKFTITLFNKKSDDNKEDKKDGLRGSVGNIIQSHYYDPDSKTLKIKFNPDFCVLFLNSILTNINFTIRRKLKKDGSKALLRFLSTHTQPGQMHILTVLNAINFNTNQPLFRLRDLLKSFIKELKNIGVLGNKTKLYNDDSVYFDIIPPKKALPD